MCKSGRLYREDLNRLLNLFYIVMLRRVCCGLNLVSLYLQTNTCIRLMSAVATFDIMLKESVSIYTKCKPALLSETTYTIAHQHVIGIVNTDKQC